MPALGTMIGTSILVGCLWLGPGGCTSTCRGPGCEASYAGARLSLVDGEAATGLLDAWLDATGLYEGDADDGTDFVVSVAQGTILLGQPDAGRVLPLGPITGAVAIPVDPPAFTAPGVSFGAAVLAQETAAGFDLWVGAPDDRFAKGSVYLFRDAHLGVQPADQADTKLTSEAPAGRLGTRLFPCGDLDGDTLPDLAVSVPWFTDPVAETPALGGGVVVILSAALAAQADAAVVPAATVGRTWWGAEEGESAGHTVLCDADIDGDGAVDLAIGAPFAGLAAAAGTGTRGRIYILDTGAGLPEGDRPLDEVARTTIEGPTEEWFGTDLALLTVDAEPVLVVGAAGFDGGQGRVWLLPRGELVENAPTITFPSDPTIRPEDRDTVHLGRTVAAADVDGDGLLDLLVGAPDYGTGLTFVDVGRVWVFLGRSNPGWDARGTTTENADLEFFGTQPFERVGRDMALADLDGDGAAEILLPTRAALP